MTCTVAPNPTTTTVGEFCGANGAGATPSAIQLHLAGTGRAQLTFGNGGVGGTVTVSLGGSVIATAGPGRVITVSFDYTPGAVLSVSEDTGRIYIPAGGLVCGADLCNAVDNAAINNFASIGSTNWVTTAA